MNDYYKYYAVWWWGIKNILQRNDNYLKDSFKIAVDFFTRLGLRAISTGGNDPL